MFKKGCHLGFTDAFWHVLNLFGPAIGLGLIAPTLAKLLWWRTLRGVGWSRLAIWVFGVSALVTLAGLAVFGHDGKIATYAGMVVGCTVALWWFGFRSR